MSESLRQQALYTWHSTKEAARIAGDVSTFTVRAWIASGELRAMNVGTKRRPDYRIRPDWLAEFMERRTNNAA